MAARTDRRVDLEAVLHAGVEVVRAVAGRGVDDAGALLERDVVGQHGKRVAVVQRVPERNPSNRSPSTRATGSPRSVPVALPRRARPVPPPRSPRRRRTRRRRRRTPGETPPPGSTGSSMASSSR